MKSSHTPNNNRSNQIILLLIKNKLKYIAQIIPHSQFFVLFCKGLCKIDWRLFEYPVSTGRIILPALADSEKIARSGAEKGAITE